MIGNLKVRSTLMCAKPCFLLLTDMLPAYVATYLEYSVSYFCGNFNLVSLFVANWYEL